MSPTRRTGDARLTLERLHELLAAYGAAPERWPAEERAAARRLVDRSAVGRSLAEDAADLDRLLDSMPVEPPSAALQARVLAAAPRRRSAGVVQRALAIGVPLAAAAAVALWLAAPYSTRRVDDATIAGIGEYTSATDVLLEPYGLDEYGTLPSIGCADSVLGCGDVSSSPEPYSQRSSVRRVRA